MSAPVAFLRREATPIDRVLSTFDREQLSGFIEVALALLDLADGDPDLEPNGDELDGTAGEDDFYPHSNWLAQPGCPISDPDACSASDDDAARSDSDGRPGDPEDGEDDDPGGDPCDQGEPEEGVLGRPLYGVDQTLPPANEAAAYRAYQSGALLLPTTIGRI